MNKALKVLLGMTIVSAILLCALLVMLINKGNGQKQESKLKEFQEQYDERNTDTKTIAPVVYTDFSKDVEEDMLYDTDRHTQVYERIEALKRNGSYTKDAPLVIYNPYGINAHSVYVYFTTAVPMKSSYRVSVTAGEIPTFDGQCNDKEEYTTIHEYLLIGLTAEASNRISLSMEDQEGNACVRTFYVTAGSRMGIGNQKLDVERGTSQTAPAAGMFVHFGNVSGTKEAIQIYDNDGILRSEFPVIEGLGKRMLFHEDLLYFNCSEKEIVGIDRFGRAKRVYSTGTYTMGEDFCLDTTAQKLLVLASKAPAEGKTASVNDILISVDLVSGEVKELLDMGILLDEYKAGCVKNEAGVLDWLGLNSIQKWDDTGVLLGAREASAAIKVKDVYGIPMLDYIVGDRGMFAGTGYENHVLTKEGSFQSFFGANTFTCVKEEGMPSGVYALYLYDNHIAGTESRPELDYSVMGKKLGSSLKKGTESYFCKYVVNETARTWEQTEEFVLDYSGYKGSAQLTPEGHLVTDTAARFAYSEFDENRTLIRKYTAAGTEYLGRVFKYDFDGFFFAGEYEVPVEEETKDSKKK